MNFKLICIELMRESFGFGVETYFICDKLKGVVYWDIRGTLMLYRLSAFVSMPLVNS